MKAPALAEPCTTCSHSISRRLSQKLALVTMVVLGVLFTCTWWQVRVIVVEDGAADLHDRAVNIARVIALDAQTGGDDAIRRRVQEHAAMNPNTRLQLWRADGRAFLDTGAPQSMSEHTSSLDFVIRTAADAAGSEFLAAAPTVVEDGALRARYTMDFESYARMGDRWAVILVVVTLAAGALVAAGTFWQVRSQLRPLQSLAAQTRAITALWLDQRLHLDDPAEELLPWVEQFNALMQRLELTYAQLEGFNADVAHELRTPLAALIGETELALSRERPAAELRDTLVSNLEELQRLSAMVNDMLFLSLADRGSVARRGEPASLAALVQQVVEFHEAAIEEVRLDVRIDGDAVVAVDNALFKRAVSNLLGNATRYAQPGTQVTIRISPATLDGVRVLVQNQGPEVAAKDLPRLFDRFFRAEVCRSCDDGMPHHGLGLAMVAAIARMHAGAPLAECEGGCTRIGFTLATAS